MKKLLILMVMAICATTTFAQDVMKELKKLKTYDEVEALLKSNLSSMLDENKAEAYNKLVDLAYAVASKEQTTMQENQVAAQMGQGKEKPVNMEAMYQNIARAIESAMECDKYDALPNAKGKVKPRFHIANRDRLATMRYQLVQAGQTANEKEDRAAARKLWGLYVDCCKSSLFADLDKKQFPDDNFGLLAYYTAVYAFQDGDVEAVNHYADLAMEDPEQYKEALNLKLTVMQQQMKTQEDTLRCLKEIEAIYAKDNSNEVVFSQLATLYGSTGQMDKQSKLVDEKLAADPNCFFAWAFRGQQQMNASQWDDAIASFEKGLAVDDKNVVVLTFCAFCYNAKVADMDNWDAQKPLLEKSVKLLEHARDLDPNGDQANWAYPLYQCYYALYGAEDSRTKQLESKMNK